MWLVWTGLALAQNPTAEQRRLQDELLKHAQRNGWPAVEKVYQKILALDVPSPSRDHLLGAQAAMQDGDILLAWHRLRRITEPSQQDPEVWSTYDESQALLEGIESRYGLISIFVREGKLPALARPEMPFSQEERDAITWVREHLRTQRGYRGVLPVGSYSIDGHHFNVEADWTHWKVVVVGDPSTEDEEEAVVLDPSVPEPLDEPELLDEPGARELSNEPRAAPGEGQATASGGGGP